ncbi:MAG: hypothetical protein OXB89_07845 [Anaerolineaceae bacterium]|nr:hypothetical protein [Anaerolineaceae bacterium]
MKFTEAMEEAQDRALQNSLSNAKSVKEAKREEAGARKPLLSDLESEHFKMPDDAFSSYRARNTAKKRQLASLQHPPQPTATGTGMHTVAPQQYRQGMTFSDGFKFGAGFFVAAITIGAAVLFALYSLGIYALEAGF